MVLGGECRDYQVKEEGWQLLQMVIGNVGEK
jgi:hypothetical protein